MFQHNFEVFDAGQPLLPGASAITIAQALVCEQLMVELNETPTPADSGAALLAATDLREVRNVHLKAERILFVDVPAGEKAMRERIEWMVHAGSRSPDGARTIRAAEAIDIMVAQLTPEAEFDPELLADELALIAEDHPEVVAALFRGDLGDVPDLVDLAVSNGAARNDLVRVAAWIFVCWAAFEQQREACLGWRLIHVRLDGAWGDEIRKSWTLGQIFHPRIEQFAFAEEMAELYRKNIDDNVGEIKDKRTINRIERKLRTFGYGWINRANDNEITALFDEDRIPALLRLCAAPADAYDRRYRSLLAGPDGRSRAGQRADMLTARISAVHRTAIVCARTCHLAALAARAHTTEDLRAMLHAQIPEVLRPGKKGQARPDKLRLRQLFFVARIEFLRDGEHLPKAEKGLVVDEDVLRLELSELERRRGHEVFDECWKHLHSQPFDWRFITPFGWQCDGDRRDHAGARA